MLVRGERESFQGRIRFFEGLRWCRDWDVSRCVLVVDAAGGSALSALDLP